MQLPKSHRGTSNFERAANDWYVEPPWIVERLLAAEPFEPSFIWDPACGGGNIPKVFKAAGFSAVGSDLIDRGYGHTGLDFLTTAAPCPPVIVTNPPFKLAEDFVRHAFHLGVVKTVILQRLAWLEGQRRQVFFDCHRLARVWVSRARVSMPPGGAGIKAQGGAVPFAWFVFDPRHSGLPVLGWV